MSISSITTHLNKFRELLLSTPKTKNVVLMFEEKIKVSAENVVAGIGAILVACLFIPIGAGLISNLVGTIYPTIATIKAIETPNKEDDFDWLVYWIVFGLFCVLENFVEFLLVFIPFYYPVKVTFLLWCMLPRFNGSRYLYETILKPYYLSKANALDAALNENDEKKTETETSKSK